MGGRRQSEGVVVGGGGGSACAGNGGIKGPHLKTIKGKLLYSILLLPRGSPVVCHVLYLMLFVFERDGSILPALLKTAFVLKWCLMQFGV